MVSTRIIWTLFNDLLPGWRIFYYCIAYDGERRFEQYLNTVYHLLYSVGVCSVSLWCHVGLNGVLHKYILSECVLQDIMSLILSSIQLYYYISFLAMLQ